MPGFYRRPVLVIPMAALIVSVLLATTAGGAQDINEADTEALIQTILHVEARQSEAIKDIVYDAEYVEGEMEDGEFKEKLRFVKKITVMFLDDTALYHEDYLEYYKDGELKSQKDLENEAKDRKEKKLKRKARDVSFPMLTPFEPDMREMYDIAYQGVTPDTIDGYLCHQFRIRAREESDDLINGDFYFETETFHLLRVDFSPAKLVKKTMFKLKELNMTVRYGPTEEGYWLPQQFDVQGKGKAALFIGVSFSGTEYYQNPQINTGVSRETFEVES